MLQRAVFTEIQTFRHGPKPDMEVVQAQIMALETLLARLREELKKS